MKNLYDPDAPLIKPPTIQLIDIDEVTKILQKLGYTVVKNTQIQVVEAIETIDDFILQQNPTELDEYARKSVRAKLLQEISKTYPVNIQTRESGFRSHIYHAKITLIRD